MGLACLMATLFEPRIHSAAIEQMFSSFAQLVGYSNPAPQIPGILKLADIQHLIREAGVERIALNNIHVDRTAAFDGIRASSERTADFFEAWLTAQ